LLAALVHHRVSLMLTPGAVEENDSGHSQRDAHLGQRLVHELRGVAGAAQVGRRNRLGHTGAASVTIAFRDQYKKKSASKKIGMAIPEMRISERRKKVTDGTDALRPPILVEG